jgi:DNA-binding transcriptional LysR family regulator
MNALSRLQRLDLHSLHLFATVAKDGSISRAAERHHIAASALSRRLADLERAVGAPLLVRSPKGVLVTAVGRVVLQHAERIHDELRCLLDDATAALEAQVTVRLCASHSVACGVLPELLRAFQPSAEHVRVEISEADSSDVVAACADGAADIGIGLGVRAPLPESVESWTLWMDRLQVLMREDHLLARAHGVRFEQVLAFPLIGSNPAGPLFELLRQQAALLGQVFVAGVTASSFTGAGRLAEAGLGLAIMPGTATPATLEAPLVRQPLLESWAVRPLKVYASRRRAVEAGCSALLTHLRRQAQLTSTLRQDRESLVPAPRLEPQFSVATLPPIHCSPTVGGV